MPTIYVATSSIVSRQPPAKAIPIAGEGCSLLRWSGVGCTGVETVTELREFLMHLHDEQHDSIAPGEVRTVIVEERDRVLPQMDRRLSRTALRRMQKMGIGLMLNTTVTGLTAAGLSSPTERSRFRPQRSSGPPACRPIRCWIASLWKRTA